MATTSKNTGCAVCATSVPAGRLMCLAHWRLVPSPLQMAVNRTWRNFQVAKTPEQRRARLQLYRDARSAAIDCISPKSQAQQEAS
jgi:hypothetical protein